MDTVVRAVSAAVLPVWVDFTSLKGLPCAPGPAKTRRGMLVTNIMVRAGVQVRAVVRVVRPLDRTNYSIQRAIPTEGCSCCREERDLIQLISLIGLL